MDKELIKSMDWIMKYIHDNDEEFTMDIMIKNSLEFFSGDLKIRKAIKVLKHYDYLECYTCDGGRPPNGHTYKATPKGYTYESWKKELRKISKPLDTAIRSNWIAGGAIVTLIIFEIIKLIIENNLCKCS